MELPKPITETPEIKEVSVEIRPEV